MDQTMNASIESQNHNNGADNQLDLKIDLIIQRLSGKRLDQMDDKLKNIVNDHNQRMPSDRTLISNDIN